VTEDPENLRIPRRRTWTGPAVFGAFDGAVTVLGGMFTLLGTPSRLVETALGLAVAGFFSMAAGQWLGDSEHGLGASLAIGAGTAAGTFLPATPYLVLRGGWAFASSVLLYLALGGGISAARARDRGAVRAAAETLCLLLVSGAAVWLCALAFGAGG
jgi:VIT1/CCC1 family predicted Fe2+/Mn2+ transporter